MGKRFFCAVAVCLALAGCGKSPLTPDEPDPVVPHANVVMTEGPLYLDEEWTFEFKGTVKNIGTRSANYAKVYIYLRNSSGTLVDQDYGFADDTDLAVGESSPWDVSWWDDGRGIRDRIDVSKTTYEIFWDEF